MLDCIFIGQVSVLNLHLTSIEKFSEYFPTPATELNIHNKRLFAWTIAMLYVVSTASVNIKDHWRCDLGVELSILIICNIWTPNILATTSLCQHWSDLTCCLNVKCQLPNAVFWKYVMRNIVCSITHITLKFVRLSETDRMFCYMPLLLWKESMCLCWQFRR